MINVEYPCQKGATGAGSHHNGFISIVLKFQQYDHDTLGISDKLIIVWDPSWHLHVHPHLSLPAYEHDTMEDLILLKPVDRLIKIIFCYN